MTRWKPRRLLRPALAMLAALALSGCIVYPAYPPGGYYGGRPPPHGPYWGGGWRGGW